MAKQYVININKGTASQVITNGDYSVSSVTTGYDDTSLDPKRVTISDDVETYNFTLSASGTLTVHVSDNGTSEGNPIVGAIFYRCDSLGNTYGDPITSNDSGNVIFNNVPYAAENPPTIYYKQTASDQTHNFDKKIYNTTLIESTKTDEVINEPAVTKVITLTDANYTGLPIETSTITLDEA